MLKQLSNWIFGMQLLLVPDSGTEFCCKIDENLWRYNLDIQILQIPVE